MVPSLPLDVLVHILNQLPTSRDADGNLSAKTIARCSAADSLFREAATLPTLWQKFYKARYLYANETSEAQRNIETNGNWRLMYMARREIDREVLKHLDAMVLHRAGRYEHARSLSRILFDAWDVLQIETGMVECSEHMKIYEFGSVPSLVVTRVYWASAMLTSIGRAHAVELWARLRLGSNSVPFVPAFSSMSCFFGKHPDEIDSLLTTLNSRCRNYLLHLNVPLSQDDPNYDLKKLCGLICDFLTSEGYGPVASNNFHDIHNLFPHFYLTTNKHTIPLSLVHIFVSIARSLGIAASPVDFPIRVLAHISIPDPEVDDFYVDVFGASRQAVLSLRDDIPGLLARQGIHPNNMIGYISPCGAGAMLSRSGRNILSSLNTLHTPMFLLRPSALLSLTIYMVLTGAERLVPQLTANAEPLDCATFITEALIPSLQGTGEAAEYLSAACKRILDTEAAIANEVKLRSSEDKSVQHFVGMLFEHKKYSYTALIIGWDPICEASEDWIREMRVKDLPRGRDQPFYSVMCMDSSSRYVAEDNIKPLLKPSTELLTEMCQSLRILPQYFTGVVKKTKIGNSLRATPVTKMTMDELVDGMLADVGGPGVQIQRARFVLSPELAYAYPEDEAIGDAWLIE